MSRHPPRRRIPSHTACKENENGAAPCPPGHGSVSVRTWGLRPPGVSSSFKEIDPMNRWLTGLLAGALVVGGAVAAELASGPQPGDKVGPFHPLNVTGESAGQKQCLVCKNGANPVVMIFAKEVTPGLTTLIKKVDAAT